MKLFLRRWVFLILPVLIVSIKLGVLLCSGTILLVFMCGRLITSILIDVDITSPGLAPWRFTGFYGHPETRQCHLSWDLLRSLTQPSSDLWVVMGDFNEILATYEKSGGPLRNNSQIQAFRGAIADCNLEDMG
ncbi:hypothetical protein M0R45_008721 [Rubus argutus]|uniref:Uncharacterized protein n=1 Tax=Rubus argutus TaxID=59490 RepID=A0AAW1Y2K1_RUBAR